MKPSQLLRKMKSLAGDNITEKVLRTLWPDKLPDSIKNILVVSSENLENLSIMADKIFEINSSSEIYSAMKNILEKVSLLEKQISELYINRKKSRNEFRNSSQTRNKSRSRSRKRFNPNGKCCFHFMFGISVILINVCKSPCSWNKASENLEKQ
ncbi:uncharacterized protein TNCT_245491 [Trichonephila clavata]|uniref:Uncharacterized protein n=1 Tax=Trichonephila clavata TaxID=2740835 RepID=A0A8X6ISB8_TRICU|nr:uncharacterized protein TNCT_245491 [Trichonephila clavata]